MNKASKSRNQKELVNQLVNSFSDHRSIQINNNTNSGSSTNFGNFDAINLTPWDYNLDSNIEIKTEKDLAIDTKDFCITPDPEDIGDNLSPSVYFDWYSMHNIYVGDKNSVSFASLKTDSNAYEEQYLSLKIFLAGCSAFYKRELSTILFPVFVHFYIDLINKPDHPTAASFYNKFQSEHIEQHKDFIQDLIKITSHTQIDLYPKIDEFLEQKISIKFSPQIYLYLLQHLRHGNYTLVLQVLNNFFVLKWSSSALNFQEDLHTLGDDVGASCRYKLTLKEQQNIESLRKSIRDVENMANTLKPSICLFSFGNAYQGLVSVSFSNRSNHLAGSFEDSSIQVWNVYPKINTIDNSIEDEKSNDGTKKDCITLRSHSGQIYSTVFSHDDAFLLSASQDKSVILWNLTTGKSLVQYKGHNYSVWDVAISPRDAHFASASFDRTVRLWDMEHAYPLRILAGHYHSVDAVRFHPNGNYLASGSSDKTCRLWDLNTGHFVRVFVGHNASVRCLSFTPDGKYLVSSGEDKSIFVWDISTGKSLKEIPGHNKNVYSLSFNEDCSMLASGGANDYINVWDCENILKRDGYNSFDKSTIEKIGSYKTDSNSIFSLKFSVGNLLLAAGISDKR